MPQSADARRLVGVDLGPAVPAAVHPGQLLMAMQCLGQLLMAMKYFSLKHDLARSCFQFWLKIGDEGDKISRKKLARREPRQFFSRNFVTLRSCFIL